MCVLCCQKRSTIIVVSARSIIVTNVLMPTIVGYKLFISHYIMDRLLSNLAISTYAACFVGKVCSVLCREGLRSNVVDWGCPLGEGTSGVKAGIFNAKVARRACARQTPPLELLADSGRHRANLGVQPHMQVLSGLPPLMRLCTAHPKVVGHL